MARRLIGLCVLGALLLAPGLASASRCDTKLTIFSGTEVVTSGAAPAATCISSATSNLDGRLIYGDHISIAYPGPYLKGRPFLLVTVNGLGFRRESVPLAWDAEDKRYLSDFTPIPWGVEGSGCLKATLTLTERRGRRTVTILRDSTTYHTLNATC